MLHSRRSSPAYSANIRERIPRSMKGTVSGFLFQRLTITQPWAGLASFRVSASYTSSFLAHRMLPFPKTGISHHGVVLEKGEDHQSLA